MWRPFCPVRDRTRSCSCAICLFRLVMSWWETDRERETAYQITARGLIFHIMEVSWRILINTYQQSYRQLQHQCKLSEISKYWDSYQYVFIWWIGRRTTKTPLTCLMMYVSSSISTALSSNKDFLLATRSEGRIKIHIETGLDAVSNSCSKISLNHNVLKHSSQEKIYYRQ